MTKPLTKNNQLILSTCTDVAELAKPLALFDVSFFQFIRFNFKKSSWLSLSNNSQWLTNFIENSLPERGYFLKNANSIPAGYYLWKTVAHTDICTIASEHFNIGNGLTINCRYKDYIDLYFFASNTSNDAINNFYVNNQEVFNHYVNYFNEKSKSILKQCKLERIKLIDQNSPRQDTLYHKDLNNFDLETYYKKTKTIRNRYYLDNEEVLLPEKQNECLTFLLQGLTIKQIALLLNISPRTCQHYVDIIRAKFHCISKQDLIAKIFSSTKNS